MDALRLAADTAYVLEDPSGDRLSSACAMRWMWSMRDWPHGLRRGCPTTRKSRQVPNARRRLTSAIRPLLRDAYQKGTDAKGLLMTGDRLADLAVEQHEAAQAHRCE